MATATNTKSAALPQTPSATTRRGAHRRDLRGAHHCQLPGPPHLTCVCLSQPQDLASIPNATGNINMAKVTSKEYHTVATPLHLPMSPPLLAVSSTIDSQHHPPSVTSPPSKSRTSRSRPSPPAVLNSSCVRRHLFPPPTPAPIHQLHSRHHGPLVTHNQAKILTLSPPASTTNVTVPFPPPPPP